MFGIENTGSALDTIAHIIQVALTPAFALSGTATASLRVLDLPGLPALAFRS
jgi:hypothetical protein